MRFLIILAAATVLVSACTGMTSVVQSRMAADYHCPADTVTVTRLPGSAYRADGCGHTATFVCTLPDGVPACVKESASLSTPGADAGTQ